jgi:dihydropteroate synthase
MPVVMGILNVTPDSFSDGGRWVALDRALEHAHGMVADGAAVIDVGGESTRPGAAPVSIEDEVRRVVPVVSSLAEDGIEVSIDTRKPEVARPAIEAGASIVNDVSASLASVAAEMGTGWIAMHMQGDPRTMQAAPSYGDVVSEVLDYLTHAAARGSRAGVERLWIDPGIGFGKTHQQNLDLLASLDRFVATGIPVAVGTSRKSFLGTLLSLSDARGDPTVAVPVPPQDRLDGSLATAMWAMLAGVALIRVHDVRATVHTRMVLKD